MIFGRIVKKQLLLLWRNPVHLLLLLGLPLVLIFILGTGLSGIMNQETKAMNLRVAVVNKGDEQAEITQFINEQASSEKNKIKQVVDNILPITMLKENLLYHEDLQDMLDVTWVEGDKEKISNQAYAAVIEIPKNFTYHFLESVFLEKKTDATLHVLKGEDPVAFFMVQSLLNRYEENIANLALVHAFSLDIEMPLLDKEEAFGQVIWMKEREPLSAKVYYTLAMAVMNVLFVASTISYYTFEEKKRHVFDRILLTNMSRWQYVIGVFLAGCFTAFLQLLIIFSFSRLFFGLSFPNIVDMLIFTIGLSLATGGLTVLLTALNFRLDSEVVTTIFASIMIYVLAFVGGSFIPIENISQLLSRVGDYTPNGAALSGYIGLVRGESLYDVSRYLYYLCGFSLSSLLLAGIFFPKRRSI